MSFDPVHDTQTVHRALVRAFSFPGRVVGIGPSASRAPECGLPSALTAVALTLLDPETTYSHPSAVLTELTGARRRPDHEAAFLMVSAWDEPAWQRACDQARCGTLSDPHLGATVVVWAPRATLGETWTASGPGLEHPLDLDLPGMGAWVAERNRSCREFPLGFDLIWVTEDAVLALPRTTRLVPRGKES